MKTGTTVASVIPTDVAEAIDRYAVKSRLSKSHVIREILIGELSLDKIKKELSK